MHDPPNSGEVDTVVHICNPCSYSGEWVVENPTSMHAAVNIRPSLKIESQDPEQRLSSDLYTYAVAHATAHTCSSALTHTSMNPF